MKSIAAAGAAHDILRDNFRQTMAQAAGSVAAVTALDGVRPHGTTVSAFLSLSMTPPLIAVALNSDSNLLALIRSTGRFGVNMLAVEQSAIATRLSGKGPDKFEGLSWSLDHGLPRLPGSAGWVAAVVEDFLPGGDHEIVVGAVLDSEVAADIAPLTYHQRTFGTHTPIG
ncbi:flavin reductase family protein [Streptomyces umbrinus]|uniref:flavin reductase family protein n=1 Tax=Streptomyces umbrinus TaxID=67370 RepID=UPI00341943DA